MLSEKSARYCVAVVLEVRDQGADKTELPSN